MSTPGASAAAPPSAAHRSPWHSPVPYLFGGFSAMLGLIAFALVVLACSYRTLSGDIDDTDNRDLEADNGGDAMAALPEFEEKYLVVMAGQEKPTFLATPMSSRASSFGSKRTFFSSENTVSSEDDYEENKVENGGRTEMNLH